MNVGASIVKLADAYPRQTISRATATLYAADLATTNPELLDQAITRLIRTSEWFPTLSEIRRACAEIALELPTEEEALTEIEDRIEWVRIRDGHDTGAAPVHSLVKQALDHVGGYHAFRSSHEPAVIRGQFLRIYRDLRADTLREAQVNLPSWRVEIEE